MQRRQFLGQLAGTAVLAAMSQQNALAAGLAARANGYNVLFIPVDDLRPQMNCYGESQILSPNFDKLAQEGIVFERTYCQVAICGASRASLLSGCRADTTRVYDLDPPLRTNMPNVLTLPEHFKNNGYETVSIGKVYHHDNDDLQGWSTAPVDSSAARWLTDEAKAWLAANPGKSYYPYECADVPDTKFFDVINTDFAIQELNRLKDKKFFLALGFRKPHLPFCAPKRFWDMYDPSKIDLADNPFAPQGANQYTLTNFPELRGYYGVPKEGPVPNDIARNLIHGYYACVSYIDAQLGRVLAELERLDLRRKTVVIVWGDHGWKLGEHASWAKHTNLEIDVHSPMIVSAPGIAGGKRTSALTEFVDIYPSLAEICGLNIPQHCEGTSFVPLLSNPGREWKSAAFSQYKRGADVMGYTMKTDRYRYTEWQKISTGEVLAKELYDHQTDPKENVNIAGQSANASLVTALGKQLKDGWRAAIPSPTGIASFMHTTPMNHAGLRKKSGLFSLNGRILMQEKATVNRILISDRKKRISMK